MGFFSKNKTYKLELTKNELAILGCVLTVWRKEAQQSNNLSSDFRELTNGTIDKINKKQTEMIEKKEKVHSLDTLDGVDYLDKQLNEAGEFFSNQISKSLKELMASLDGKDKGMSW